MGACLFRNKILCSNAFSFEKFAPRLVYVKKYAHATRQNQGEDSRMCFKFQTVWDRLSRGQRHAFTAVEKMVSLEVYNMSTAPLKSKATTSPLICGLISMFSFCSKRVQSKSCQIHEAKSWSMASGIRSKDQMYSNSNCKTPSIPRIQAILNHMMFYHRNSCSSWDSEIWVSMATIFE